MDFFHDADPLISSAIYSEVLDFDPYSRPRMMIEESGTDIPMSMDSPASMETYESEMELTFHDSSSVVSVTDDGADSVVDTPQKDDDADIEADRRLVSERFAPYDLFPADNNWTLEERIDKLLRISPCRKYSREDLLHIDSVESPDRKVDMLIEVVSKVHVNHRWNYVQPHELHRGYTVVANCKKEKKKDSDGHSCPKRPMNAFMIWSMKCRALIAQITPQLHNAIISTKLGAAWRKFDDEEKAIYEREKDILGTFHKFEFPDYKYKPKKKAKRVGEKQPSETKPQKGCKRKRSESSTSSPLRGINLVDARQNLDPLLKERLIVKMQVKIDPLLKKGIGKRVTAIDLSELTNYNQTQLQLTQTPPRSDQLPKNTSSGVNIIIDSQPTSVFDTPENSPNKLVPPASPTDDHLTYSYHSSYTSDRCFKFDDNTSLPDSPDADDSFNNSASVMHIKSETDLASSIDPQTNLSIDPRPNLSIDPQPNLRWNFNLCIKTEPLDHFGLYSALTTIKAEPELASLAVPAEGNIPVLSAETVESVLDNECVSSFNNEDLLDDFMKYLDNDICFSADLLPSLTVLTEGPTVV